VFFSERKRGAEKFGAFLAATERERGIRDFVVSRAHASLSYIAEAHVLLQAKVIIAAIIGPEDALKT
jgi:hypothetical protein